MSMNRRSFLWSASVAVLSTASLRAQDSKSVIAETTFGKVRGIDNQGIKTFKGIPYGASTAGKNRFMPPVDPAKWTGVRDALEFGHSAPQRDPSARPAAGGNLGVAAQGLPAEGEDCLVLNVWTPALNDGRKRPVMFWCHGGGFATGSGSSPVTEGLNLAKRGDVVVVTINHRLNVLGFTSLEEAGGQEFASSGDVGMMDIVAALRWVHDNIAAFGGDPAHVTIAGESAGSASVSAQMASPLSKGLIAGAIGESGALISPTLGPAPLSEAEQNGVKFAGAAGAASLLALRTMSAQQVLDVTARQDAPRLGAAVDGYLFPKTPLEIYSAGQQAQVPLLAGWNSAESNAGGVLGRGAEPTADNYAAALKRLYPDNADEASKVYAGSTPDEIEQAATDLASDRFIAYSTWKWLDLHAKTGKPTYRYYYSRPRPAMVKPEPDARPSRGATHSAEIEYAMGNLETNKVYAWTDEDRKVSQTMQEYFANFIKKGDPNGPGLPEWPPVKSGDAAPQVMHIDVNTRAEADRYRERYLFLDRMFQKR